MMDEICTTLGGFPPRVVYISSIIHACGLVGICGGSLAGLWGSLAGLWGISCGLVGVLAGLWGFLVGFSALLEVMGSARPSQDDDQRLHGTGNTTPGHSFCQTSVIDGDASGRIRASMFNFVGT